jgi:hypothetical protein
MQAASTGAHSPVLHCPLVEHDREQQADAREHDCPIAPQPVED